MVDQQETWTARLGTDSTLDCSPRQGISGILVGMHREPKTRRAKGPRLFEYRRVDPSGDVHIESQAEIRFLEYRREVIEGWPDSPRKRVMIAGIERRLTSMRGTAS
jgi:hypothetical protein